MIIIYFSIVLYYCFTKTSELMFIGCHNVRLESCWMVVTASMHALSWHDDICACALTFLYHTHWLNSDLRRHFIIDENGIFPSLRRTISYPYTMSAYDLFIFFLFPLSPRCILSFILLSPHWIQFLLLIYPFCIQILLCSR